MLESLASELKTAMETEAKNGRVSQEKVAELTRLVNQLTKRVHELELGNTAKTRSLLSDIENILKTTSRYHTLYSRLRDFIAIVTTILSVLGYKPPEKLEGPSNFEDFGKETIDLLSEEYFCGWKLSVFPGFESDLLISAGQSVLNGVSTSDISAKFSVDNLAGLVTYTDNGNLTTKWSLDKLFGQQGVKCNLHLDYPLNGKLELLSRHKYAALRASVGLTVNPVTSLSVLLGSKGKMFGGSVDIDTAQGTVTSYSYGAKYRSDQCSLSLSVDNLSEITACLHQECWDYTSVGAQLVHSLVTGETRLSAGVEYAVNPAFVMKARGDHTGLVSALGRVQLTPNSSLTMSAEVDVRAIRQAPRVGLSFRFDGRRV